MSRFILIPADNQKSIACHQEAAQWSSMRNNYIVTPNVTSAIQELQKTNPGQFPEYILADEDSLATLSEALFEVFGVQDTKRIPVIVTANYPLGQRVQEAKKYLNVKGALSKERGVYDQSFPAVVDDLSTLAVLYPQISRQKFQGKIDAIIYDNRSHEFDLRFIEAVDKRLENEQPPQQNLENA